MNPERNEHRGKQSGKLRKRLLIGAAALVVLLAVVFAVYVNDYYRALPFALPAMSDGSAMPVGEYDGFTIYGDSTHGIGIIFYPGGKVETNAYEPLFYGLAQRGICCVAVDMPLHLAVFKPDAADEIIRQIASIDEWYICGHSLGGAMAARYASAHQDVLRGLILLAAYPTDQLGISFPVLSIYGSLDGVLNRDKYELSKLLAPSLQEVIIDGGNHAQFGNYGAQKGDGTAEISAETQWNEAVSAISAFILTERNP
ncbi:MAG: alpha/beta fold hydrolase [Eubacteriales bacterium]|nr:alpha/beta fold hydrolase [Eubacteriales bacterium]